MKRQGDVTKECQDITESPDWLLLQCKGKQGEHTLPYFSNLQQRPTVLHVRRGVNNNSLIRLRAAEISTDYAENGTGLASLNSVNSVDALVG